MTLKVQSVNGFSCVSGSCIGGFANQLGGVSGLGQSRKEFLFPEPPLPPIAGELNGFEGLGETSSSITSYQKLLAQLSSLLKSKRYAVSVNGQNDWNTFIATIHLFRDFVAVSGPHAISMGGVKSKIASIPGIGALLKYLDKESFNTHIPGIGTVKVDSMLYGFWVGQGAYDAIRAGAGYLGVNLPNIQIKTYMKKLTTLVSGIASTALAKLIPAIIQGVVSVKNVTGATPPPPPSVGGGGTTGGGGSSGGGGTTTTSSGSVQKLVIPIAAAAAAALILLK